MSLPYVPPIEVTSPKVSISNLKPIIDRGEWKYSVALLDWDRQPSVGIRWNGGTENGKIHPGNPQSRGLPTWFILPEGLDIPILIELKKTGGLGGPNIESAEQALEEFLSRRGAAELAAKQNSTLEDTVTQIILNLKAQGKI